MKGIDIIFGTKQSSARRSVVLGAGGGGGAGGFAAVAPALSLALNAAGGAIDLGQAIAQQRADAERQQNAASDAARQHDVDLAAARSARQLADAKKLTASLLRTPAAIADAAAADATATALEVAAGLKPAPSPGGTSGSWWRSPRVLVAGALAAGVVALAVVTRRRVKAAGA